MTRVILFGLLAAVAAGFLFAWVRQLRRQGPLPRPTLLETAIGFVTNFFDTLGIGSFAPTTSAYRARGLVPDEDIPGTMNVGHSLPVVLQAFIYVSIVQVDTATLVTLVAASVLGSVLGVGVVARWPRRRIQVGMGVGLLLAGTLLVLRNLDELRGTPFFPGGDATGLTPGLLALAAAGNFVLGALVTLGIGLYAPCLIMVSLLGLNPLTAFPIMMGSCAFLMPLASVRVIATGRYQPRPALGLVLGGLPAVALAAFVVKSLPLTWVRWLVVVVVLVTAWRLLRAARTRTHS